MPLSDSNALLLRAIRDALRRILVHYGFWFNETLHQFGLPEALALEKEVGDRVLDLALLRLSQTLGFEVDNGVPAALGRLAPDRLEALLDTLAKLWLASDGIWFQAVEAKTSIHDAKRVNDTCWTRFSPFEAGRIKALLELPDAAADPAPLATLKTILAHRLYSRINCQEVVEETPHSFIFRMTDCRVQAARRRKGLADYDCRSGGLVEYVSLARAVHPAIVVECLACPSGEPQAAEQKPRQAWYCAWRFSLAESNPKSETL